MHIVDVHMEVKAKGLPNRHRVPKEIPVVYKVPAALRDVASADAPVACRLIPPPEEGQPGRYVIREFDGQLWRPFAFWTDAKRPERYPVELPVFKLLLQGQIDVYKNKIRLPSAPSPLEPNAFRQVIDSGLETAQTEAQRLLDDFILVDGVVHKKSGIPVRHLTFNSAHASSPPVGERIALAPSAWGNGSVQFPLESQQEAHELGRRIVQSVSPGAEVRPLPYRIEIERPASLWRSPPELLRKDLERAVACIGAESAISRFDEVKLAAWIEIRSTLESSDGIDVAGRLVRQMAEMTIRHFPGGVPLHRGDRSFRSLVSGACVLLAHHLALLAERGIIPQIHADAAREVIAQIDRLLLEKDLAA